MQRVSVMQKAARLVVAATLALLFGPVSVMTVTAQLNSETPERTSTASRNGAADALSPEPIASLRQDLEPLLVTTRDQERLRQVAAARRTSNPSEDYIIGADDLLEVTVPDLTDQAPRRAFPQLTELGPAPIAPAPSYLTGLRVSGSGYITLPILGSVRAAGRTPRQIEHLIEGLLVEGGILRRPQVSVLVVEYRSRVVSVVGEVQRPGLYPVTGSSAKISEMLWAAGGPTALAGRIIAFVPAGAGSPEVESGDGTDPTDPIWIDLETLMQRQGDLANDPPAWPGDMINVLPAGTLSIDGWIAKPGSYGITRGLTVAGVIASAGGPLFPAKLGAVEVLRTFGAGEQERFTVDIAAIRSGKANDMPLKDGDVVRVPADPIRLVPWGVWRATAAMVRIGGSLVFF